MYTESNERLHVIASVAAEVFAAVADTTLRDSTTKGQDALHRDAARYELACRQPASARTCAEEYPLADDPVLALARGTGADPGDRQDAQEAYIDC